jgi:Cytotoxic
VESTDSPDSQRGQRKAPPEKLPAFPTATRTKPKTRVAKGGSLRRRWKDNNGTIYEWDSQHGTLEAYDSRGNHKGEFDHVTGKQLKPANASRKIEP